MYDYSTVERFARETGIESEAEWKEIVKLGWLPDGIPTDPENYYSKYSLEDF